MSASEGDRRMLRRSPNAIGERRLDLFAGVKRVEDGDGFDRLAGEFRRDILVDRREPDDLYIEPDALRLRRFQLLAHAAQTEFEGVPHDRLFDRVGVGREPVSDRSPDEVGAVRVEPLANQEIDVAEVDESHVDRLTLRVETPCTYISASVATKACSERW